MQPVSLNQRVEGSSPSGGTDEKTSLDSTSTECKPEPTRQSCARFIFYLGTHEPCWLGRTDVPLFVSRVRLHRAARNLRAIGPWALDSGGFSELNDDGRWSITPRQYVAEAWMCAEKIGNLQWAAIMDWMCEPEILAKTGLSVYEHQRRTVDSYLELKRLADVLPWVPVLQGYEFDEYLACAEMYAAAGVDLRREPLVGVGSVCRRQSTAMAEGLIQHLYGVGLKLHGFGFKTEGLPNVAHCLSSADSMAWSYNGRKNKKAGKSHKCANCMACALRWRDGIIDLISRPLQDAFLWN